MRRARIMKRTGICVLVVAVILSSTNHASAKLRAALATSDDAAAYAVHRA